MRTSRTILIILLIVGVAWGAWGWFLCPLVSAYCVGIHQKNVTKELAKWGDEHSHITNDASAIQAAKMVAYMSWYYVPSPGYRGPADVEAALQSQRRKSMENIVAALEKHTGLHFGVDPKRWEKWAEEQQARQGLR
jgi:hypothetical protein